MRLMQPILAVISLFILQAFAQNVNELSAIADKDIWFLGPGTFEERVITPKQGTWLVFYATRWCPYCKKLNPKWLELQKQVAQEQLYTKGFSMAKVDCTDVAGWCSSNLKVKGYPNLYVYHNGEYVDEYLGQHEADVIMAYIKQKMALYDSAQPPVDVKQPPSIQPAGENDIVKKDVKDTKEDVKVAPEVPPIEAQAPTPDAKPTTPAANQVIDKKDQNAASPQQQQQQPINPPTVPTKAAVPIGNPPNPPVEQKPLPTVAAPAGPVKQEAPAGPVAAPNNAAGAAPAVVDAKAAYPDPVAYEDDDTDHKPIKGVAKHPRKEFRGFRGFLQTNFVTPLVGPECSTSLLSFQWFSHFDCTRLLISKVLGIGLVAGGAVIKLPQIFKIFQKRSALGVSFASYALETAAYIAGLAYNVRRGNAFNTYGEHAFMAVANCIVIAMMYHYTRRHKDLVVIGTLTFIFTVSLFTKAIINDTLLLSFQWIAILVGVVSKVPQIHSNWSNQSCGQLSAVTVGLQTIGSLARCFTTATEVKDTVIFVTYLVATALNGTVLYQVVIYWGRKRKAKSLLD
ncbi:hypothetical protein BCR33DRAFT_716748 [Rhizoclosmatium globosum]|uniref:Thioredoxin domain-containing protein n=1 Tax=Rhizoclosmatium globosum TaxID=329046 RepID=A0A1Y2CCM9_9FUNG|nr:hypothetical protein BCR33DRAFT_716748 [Rhizoclosmatium globosum]|eukprot:ORY44799.1 hypothetical protein BCR33DRAFT_716748 [Rhizoclosmatium globosum]